MRFGLYTRLALSVGIVLCAALLTLGYLLLTEAESQFRQQRLDRAAAQVRTLAEGSLDALVTGDYELLERWVAAVLPAGHYAYAYLASPDGLILTHTDLNQVGHTGEALGQLTDGKVREISVEGRRVRQVAYPARIGEQHLANAVVAYDLDEQAFHTSKTASQIATVVGLFLILLLGATLFIIRRHLEPLSALSNAMTTTSLSAASLKQPDPALLARDDEVGLLAVEYKKLLDRLQASYEELRNEEQRLRDMVAARTHKLEQSNRELEAFSYSVSHDLRAPLRSVDGFCQALLEDYGNELDATGKDYLARARAASQHMARLIDDLLDLSRVGRADLQWQTVDLSALAEASLKRLRAQQAQRDVDTTVWPDLTASGDPVLLSIMLDNLIGNAWKYTGHAETPSIEFAASEEAGETVYYVKDNGIGFDMQYSAKVFGPFQRLHRRDEFEGTGIGLATVQRIIQRHNGRIWAQAKVNAGATFFFTIGAAPGDAGQAPATPDQA